jgi:hypothetical protein
VILSAALIALAAGSVSGCGSSSASTSASFAGCLASPLPVNTGELIAVAIQGGSCDTGEGVASSAILALMKGGKADGSPVSIDGWLCESYTGIDQMTCTHGPATLYAQYSL